MLERRRFEGTFTPMITPMDPDGRVQADRIPPLADRILEAGIGGLFPLGSTGEGPALSEKSARTVLRRTVEAAPDGVPVLAGAMDAEPDRVLARIAWAAEEGADAAVCTVPFYYPLYRPREIERYYRRLADEAALPIVVYNMPGTTGTAIPAEVMLRLVDHPRVLGIKDSSGDWTHVQRLLLGREDPSFRILIGKEQLAAAALRFGADGIVTGLSNVHPGQAAALVRAARAGDHGELERLQRSMNRLCAIFEDRPWLLAIKTAMARLGLCGPHAAFPFEDLPGEDVREIEEILRTAGLLEG